MNSYGRRDCVIAETFLFANLRRLGYGREAVGALPRLPAGAAGSGLVFQRDKKLFLGALFARP